MSTDDELLAHLRRIADETDAAPAYVHDGAQGAFSTRRLDDELAELLRDSDLAPSGVRGGRPRLLSFETATVSLELQIDEAAGRVSVSGLAVGSVAVGSVAVGSVQEIDVQEIEVQTTTVSRRVCPDSHGWFRADDLPAGPLRVRVLTSAGPAVTTGWLGP